MPSRAGRHVRNPREPESFGASVRLILLSAVLPGSAQVITKRARVVGFVALALWALLLLGALAVAVVAALGSLAMVLSVTVDSDLLAVVRIGTIVVGVGWLVLLLHAIALARPWAQPGGRRIVAVGTAAAVVLAGTLPVVLVQRYAGIQRDLVDSVFRADENNDDGESYTEARRREEPHDGRYNVLLLGGDGGDGRQGVRTDSIQLASVDWATGDVVLIGLPRNLIDAPFPPNSPMGRQFPDGFPQFIFGVYDYAVDHPQLFPGSQNPGAEAIMQSVSEITGLRVDSYVLVNLEGFSRVVDAIGGVTIRVTDRIPIGGVVQDGMIVSYPHDYIEPGLHHLDGYHALWYARARFGTSDYDRMRRQRCVIGALARQANPRNVLLNYQQLASTTKDLVETDIPQSLLPDLLELALEVRTAEITSLTFDPDNVDSADPDYDEVRALVAETIEEAESDPVMAGGASAPSPAPRTLDDLTDSGGTDSDDGAVNGDGDDDSAELADVCRYS
jgi:LCP family protein required for cell wall assembly